MASPLRSPLSEQSHCGATAAVAESRPMNPQVQQLAASVKASSPMLRVPNMRETVAWYRSLGFTIADEFEDDGELVFARVTFGAGEFTLSAGATTGPRDVSLWFITDRVEELYAAMKQHDPPPPFDEELYQPFYGGRQFSISDLNGVSVIFWHPEWVNAS